MNYINNSKFTRSLDKLKKQIKEAKEEKKKLKQNKKGTTDTRIDNSNNSNNIDTDDFLTVKKTHDWSEPVQIEKEINTISINKIKSKKQKLNLDGGMIL